MNTFLRTLLMLCLLVMATSCAPVAMSDILPTLDLAPEDNPLNKPVATYTLSGSPNRNSSFSLEGVLTLIVNGQTRERYQGQDETLGPITFSAHVSSEIVLQLSTAGFGSSCNNDTLYVRKDDGSSQKVLDSFRHAICSNGIVNENEPLVLE